MLPRDQCVGEGDSRLSAGRLAPSRRLRSGRQPELERGAVTTALNSTEPHRTAGNKVSLPAASAFPLVRGSVPQRHRHAPTHRSRMPSVRPWPDRPDRRTVPATRNSAFAGPPTTSASTAPVSSMSTPSRRRSQPLLGSPGPLRRQRTARPRLHGRTQHRSTSGSTLPTCPGSPGSGRRSRS